MDGDELAMTGIQLHCITTNDWIVGNSPAVGDWREPQVSLLTKGRCWGKVGLGEMTVRKKSDQVLAGKSLARKKTNFSSPKSCRASSSQLSLMESWVKKC